VSTFLRNTTSAAVNKALLATRRTGGSASGHVLTLLVCVGGEEQDAAVEAATRTAGEHPSRILVANGRPESSPSRLDAEVFGAGERGPGELVILDLHGELADVPASVVLPLLVPDTPVVTYWPGTPPPAPSRTPLGALSQRRVTDLGSAPDAPTRLLELARQYCPGDTDLAWTRLTPWRSLLAAALDQERAAVTGGRVAGEAGNPSARLLAAWLSSRLGVPVEVAATDGPGITDVELATARGPVAIRRTDGRLAMLSVPGWPERPMALKRRGLAELMAEELRRLDPDDIYEECLAAVLAAATAVR
jgi:glucose-6-phosphate dehydrogenase assembly protein OpcA